MYPTSFLPSMSLSRRSGRRTRHFLGGDAVIWGIVYVLVKDNAVFPMVLAWGRLILFAVHQVVPYAFRKGWWMRGKKRECREYILSGRCGGNLRLRAGQMLLCFCLFFSLSIKVWIYIDALLHRDLHTMWLLAKHELGVALTNQLPQFVSLGWLLRLSVLARLCEFLHDVVLPQSSQPIIQHGPFLWDGYREWRWRGRKEVHNIRLD